MCVAERCPEVFDCTSAHLAKPTISTYPNPKKKIISKNLYLRETKKYDPNVVITCFKRGEDLRTMIMQTPRLTLYNNCDYLWLVTSNEQFLSEYRMEDTWQLSDDLSPLIICRAACDDNGIPLHRFTHQNTYVSNNIPKLTTMLIDNISAMLSVDDKTSQPDLDEFHCSYILSGTIVAIHTEE